MKTRAVIFSLIVAVIFSSISYNNKAYAGENEDFRFAEKLRRDRMYIAAAEEYIRFCDKYPVSTLHPKALFSAGESWMQAGKPQKALESFETYLNSYPEDNNICKAMFYRGHIYKKIERYQDGASEFLLLADEYQDCPLVERALLEAGECLLSAGNAAEAAKALKRLITEYKDTDFAARALYTISLALISMDRELEACSNFEKLARNYPDSPLAGFALLKLGERAVDMEESEKAERYFRKVIDDYEEVAIKEKARFNLIDIYLQGEDYKSALSESEIYIENFKKANRRDGIYIIAIAAASKIDDTRKSLSLIDDYRKEFAEGDSTGWTYVKSAKLLWREGQIGKALRQLESMKKMFPETSYSSEVLLLTADLNFAAGLKRKAIRYYNLVLAENGLTSKAEDGLTNQPGEILVKLAGIYSDDLADTLSAVRCLEEAAVWADGETKQKALFKAARLRELAGNYEAAVLHYSRLLGEFPGGDYSPEAKKRLELLGLKKQWDKNLAGKLKSIASSDKKKHLRFLETGIVFYEDARDFDTAIELIEKALSGELSEDMGGKARFYLGKAYLSKYRISVLKDNKNEEYHNKASSLWLDVARNFNSTRWGEEAHKAYLDCKFEKWTLDTRIQRLDEFLKYYGAGSNRWWALKQKADFLYEAAVSGEKWAVDSTMKVCEEILIGSPPDNIKYDAVKKKGYLYRGTGNYKRASELFTEYLSYDSSGPARARVCYDLGEIRISLKEYQKAIDAYNCCLKMNPGGGLAENSYLRRGDCYFFMKRYEEAEKEYEIFPRLFPVSSLSDVAEFRRGLTLDRIRKTERADSIFRALLDRENIDSDLRVKLLGKMGKRYHSEMQFDKAKRAYTELVSLEKTAANLTLLAELLEKTGDMIEAEESFSGALALAESDTCRILKGRAKTRYRLGKYGKGEKDLEKLWELCPDSEGVASVLLEKGMIFINNKDPENARKTLDYITDRFKETEYAKTALYYLALCDIEGGGYLEAEEKLNLFLAGSPHSPIVCMAYFKLASAELKMEKLNLAARNFTLASEVCSNSELSLKALKNLARIYQKMENWEKASSTWEEIIEKHPADVDIVELLFKLGFSYSQAGRYRLAYDVYSRIPAIAVNEKELGRAHYWAGISLKNIGKYREAIREFLRVPYLRTGGMWGVTSELEAAGCYAKLERYDEAARIYGDIISSHGKNSDWGKIAAGALTQIQNEKNKQQSDKNGQKEIE